MIPRIIHRIWLDDPMPDEFTHYGARWRELHPDWTLMDWRDRTTLHDLQQAEVFARARELCPGDWKRFESDVLRLELLWTFGGVYVDTDAEPLRPLDDLLAGVECFASWSPNRGPGGQRLLTQAVIGSTPGHPFIGRCLDGLPAAVADFAGRPLAQMIGPWHISRTHELFPSGVTVFDEHVFGPQSNGDRDCGVVPDLSRSWVWHRWANTRDRRHGGVR